MESLFRIDRKKFIDICISKSNKNYLDICINDLNSCACEFGFDIKTYLSEELVCNTIDEKKIMLFKIKYEI